MKSLSVIAVLNGPGWLRGQPEGDIVRVYWGSSNGFLLTDRTDFGVQQAVDVAAHDFDGDGSADLAILTGCNRQPAGQQARLVGV